MEDGFKPMKEQLGAATIDSPRVQSRRFSMFTSEGNRDAEQAPESTLRKLAGSLILASSIMGGSSIGVMNNYIPIPSPFAKNAWRNGLIIIYFFVPAIAENLMMSVPIKIRLKQYLYIVVTLIMQVFWVFGLTYASSRTIQSHAYLMNNVHGLFMVIIGLFTGKKILAGEFKGLIYALIGCAFILADPNA